MRLLYVDQALCCGNVKVHNGVLFNVEVDISVTPSPVMRS